MYISNIFNLYNCIRILVFKTTPSFQVANDLNLVLERAACYIVGVGKTQ